MYIHDIGLKLLIIFLFCGIHKRHLVFERVVLLLYLSDF